MAKIRKFRAGDTVVDTSDSADKTAGLAASNAEKKSSGFLGLGRLFQGNIDQKGSEAYEKYGAGYGREVEAKNDELKEATLKEAALTASEARTDADRKALLESIVRRNGREEDRAVTKDAAESDYRGPMQRRKLDVSEPAKAPAASTRSTGSGSTSTASTRSGAASAASVADPRTAEAGNSRGSRAADPRTAEAGNSRGSRAAEPADPRTAEAGNSRGSRAADPRTAEAGNSRGSRAADSRTAEAGNSRGSRAADLSKPASKPAAPTPAARLAATKDTADMKRSQGSAEDSYDDDTSLSFEERRKRAEMRAKRGSTTGTDTRSINERFKDAFKAKGGAIQSYAKGGAVSASRRGDGIAQRGKTRGKMC